VFYREPKLLKGLSKKKPVRVCANVSVLYREPKLLKAKRAETIAITAATGFSALP